MTDQTPSGREIEILKVLWELGSASVREVYERMCPREELAFNTIQTLLRIMDEKGLVTHKVEGRTFVYSPAYSREQETARFLDKVFDGAMDQFVASLLKSRRVSPRELEQLQALLAGAKRGAKPKSEH
ncbi:MAG TPA: BlaI/MecI/CopY family transcriptional regulator [Planctomycetaceae bacterium]|nr:BlaI/MecI/CopY family transcriptional regulator [Planctomycetaceae bacterium]